MQRVMRRPSLAASSFFLTSTPPPLPPRPPSTIGSQQVSPPHRAAHLLSPPLDPTLPTYRAPMSSSVMPSSVSSSPRPLPPASTGGSRHLVTPHASCPRPLNQPTPNHRATRRRALPQRRHRKPHLAVSHRSSRWHPLCPAPPPSCPPPPPCHAPPQNFLLEPLPGNRSLMQNPSRCRLLLSL